MTADKSWEYMLPTGERLEASVDEAGVESVVLGQRLVSRSPAGAKVEGHTIALGQGPFRGGGALRVVFTDGACDVSIDGHPLEPSSYIPPVAQKKDPHDVEIVLERPTKTGTSLTGAFVFVILVAVIIGIALLIVRSNPKGAVSLPNRGRTDSFDEVRYPAGWRITDVATPGRGVVVLTDGAIETVTLVAMNGGPSDLWDLDALLATSDASIEGEAFRKAVPLVDIEHKIDTCAGHEAAVIDRTLSVARRNFRVRSCAFRDRGRGYRFSFVTPDEAFPDQTLILNAIFDQVKLPK